MHHTVAWRLSLSDATATDVTPVPDGIMAIQNGHFVPTVDYNLLYAYFGAATPNRARFISPSLRQISTPWIRPVNTDIVPGHRPGVADYSRNPLTVKGLEELQLEGMQTTGGAAVVVGLAGLARSPVAPAPAGNPIMMRGTGGTTVTAGAWTQVAMTWQDVLPSGRYAVVGLQGIGTTCVGVRLIFEDQVERPGALGCSAEDLAPPDLFLNGNLGVYGRFDANRMPNVEFFCNAADTAQQVFLQFVRVS